MSHDATPCIRGCTTRRRHLYDCEDRDTCRGCHPRYATHGLLCESCHAQLAEWLRPSTDTFEETSEDGTPRQVPYSSLAWVEQHLTRSMAGVKGVRTREDYERPSAEEGRPLPFSARMYDVRTQLRDAVYVAEERAREALNLSPAEGLFTVDRATAMLRTWLASIERDADLVTWLWGSGPEGPNGAYPDGRMFAGAMVSAHMAAPWRPERRRVPGIPCPHCDVRALVIFGGSADVTCTHCWATIPRERYDQWAYAYAQGAA